MIHEHSAGGDLLGWLLQRAIVVLVPLRDLQTSHADDAEHFDSSNKHKSYS